MKKRRPVPPSGVPASSVKILTGISTLTSVLGITNCRHCVPTAKAAIGATLTIKQIIKLNARIGISGRLVSSLNFFKFVRFRVRLSDLGHRYRSRASRVAGPGRDAGWQTDGLTLPVWPSIPALKHAFDASTGSMSNRLPVSRRVPSRPISGAFAHQHRPRLGDRRSFSTGFFTWFVRRTFDWTERQRGVALANPEDSA